MTIVPTIFNLGGYAIAPRRLNPARPDSGPRSRKQVPGALQVKSLPNLASAAKAEFKKACFGRAEARPSQESRDIASGATNGETFNSKFSAIVFIFPSHKRATELHF